MGVVVIYVRLQRSAGNCKWKQYHGAMDHVTLPWLRNELKLEHNDTGYQYHSLLRSTPVDARPAGAAVENETSSRKLSGRSPSVHHRNLESNVSYRNDVGNHRSSFLSSRPNYRYLCISLAYT